MEHGNSKRIYEEAKRYIPGGVNSPVRAFKSVGLDPVFIESGKGSRVTDADGNSYIDFVCSWGPLILGHSPEHIYDGIEDVIRKGTSFGLPTETEVKMARLICEALPGMDMVRMVNSGTEATMSALRLARAYTGRDKIIKFEGCYHGHCDSLLVKAGSGALTFGVPTTPGVPQDVIKDTIVCRYNDMTSVEAAFRENNGGIAAVIVEPVAGNMGVVPPREGFLEALREITKRQGALLIFDEVITGFRLSYDCAQGVYCVEPDITCLGKIIGGGLPVGAYGGKREIMSMVSPLGSVYQAGTLSGNPLAMHMGMRTLEHLRDNPQIYSQIEYNAIRLEAGLKNIIDELSIDACVTRVKGMVCLFLDKGPMESHDDVIRCDTARYAVYFREMLERGIIIPPAQFEGWFLSYAHTREDIEAAIKASRESLEIAFKDIIK